MIFKEITKENPENEVPEEENMAPPKEKEQEAKEEPKEIKKESESQKGEEGPQAMKEAEQPEQPEQPKDPKEPEKTVSEEKGKTVLQDAAFSDIRKAEESGKEEKKNEENGKKEKKKAGKKLSKKALIGMVTGLVALLLVITILITGFAYPGFFLEEGGTPFNPNISGGTPNYRGTNEEELLNIQPVYHPKFSPESGSKAFQIQPVKGITLSAEKNALDKDREFKVELESEEKLDEYFMKTVDFGEIPLASIHVDAGMKLHEKFPGTVKMEFSLKELNVEEELWPFLSVMCENEDGSLVGIHSEVKNGVLTCYTNHNSAFVVTVSMLLTIGPGIIWALDYGRMGIPKDEYCVEKVKMGEGPTARTYLFYYPKRDELKNSPGILEMRNKEKSLWNKYYQNMFDEACGENYGAAALKNYQSESSKKRQVALALAKDPEYQKIQKTYQDQTWREENVWPTYVKRTVKMVRHADKFLIDVYMFRHPIHEVEIYIVNDSTGSDAYAHTDNFVTTHPFIKVYKNISGFENDTGLAITMAHELFHVIQAGRYSQIDSRSDNVFWESTAIMVERDAYRYYVKENIVKADEKQLTKRKDWGDLRYSLLQFDEWTVKTTNELLEKLSQSHGYTSSHFIEFMMKRYKKWDNEYDRRSFMRQLMREYSDIFVSDGMEALMNCTSGNEKALAHDYLVFCMQNTENFCNVKQQMTIAKRNFYPLKSPGLVENIPISTEPVCCEGLAFASPVAIKEFKTVIILNDEKDPDDYEDTILRVVDKEDCKPIRFMRGNGICVLENKREFFIQVVNATMDSTKGGSFKVIFMAPPEKGSVHTDQKGDGLADDEVVIPVKAHTDLGMTATFRYDGEEIEAECNKGDTEIRILKQKILDTLGVKTLEEVTVTLKYRLDPPKKTDEKPIYSPESEEFPATKLKADIEDFAGTYVGTYVDTKGKSCKARFTVEILEVVSETSAKCYFTYDFGELGGKWDGYDSHGNRAWKYLILREDHALIHYMDTITFTIDAETIHYERTNFIGETATMDGTKQK